MTVPWLKRDQRKAKTCVQQSLWLQSLFAGCHGGLEDSLSLSRIKVALRRR